MILHFGLSTLQGKPRSMRDGQWKSTFKFTIRQSLRLPVTPTTNTKGNDMANWGWNVMGWTSDKDKQIEELRAENGKLRRMYDEVLESEHNLNVQVEKLQATNDELIAENKSNHNVGIQYRTSAERLSLQVDDLTQQIATRNTQIVNLKNRVQNMENSITRCLMEIGNRS